MRRRIRRGIFCFFAALWFAGVASGTAAAEESARSSPRIILHESDDFYSLKDRLEILEDPNGVLSLNQIRRSDGFQTARTETPAFGFTSSVYWIRFSLRNPGPGERRLFVELTDQMLNRVDFFVFAGDVQEKHVATGGDLPFVQRELPHRNLVFRLHVPPGQERVCYMRFASHESMVLPILLASEQGYLLSTYRGMFVQGIYYGTIVVMLFYNLILYLSYRDRSYLYYVLYIVSFLFVQLTLSGFAYQYLWPAHPEWNNMARKFFVGFANLWALSFTRSFLSVRRYSRWLDNCLILWMFFSVLLCLYAFIRPDRTAAIAANVIPLTMTLLLMAAGGLAFLRGYRPARYFLLGWSALIVGVVLLTLLFLGALPGNFLTRNALMIGSALEMILLSLGLRDRIITARLEKEAGERRHTEARLRLLDSFARFVPRQFLEHLRKESPEEVAPGDAVREEITVLFSDLREFTALSESLSVEDNFRFINSYVQAMQPVIASNGGFIDKFIGDAIMALFPRPDDALRAALDMRSALEEFNQKRSAAGQLPVDMGIGLNTGELMLGTVGTSERLDTTVIGDSVNLASRLESLTSRYGTPILISEYVVERLHEPRQFALRELDLVRVKGKQKPVRVYELLGLRGLDAT